jgi:hypothetical protein
MYLLNVLQWNLIIPPDPSLKWLVRVLSIRGQIKSVYWRAKLADKKGKENVLRWVSLEEEDGKEGVSKRMVRKFTHANNLSLPIFS